MLLLQHVINVNWPSKKETPTTCIEECKNWPIRRTSKRVPFLTNMETKYNPQMELAVDGKTILKIN
jgi:hypothetical protein